MPARRAASRAVESRPLAVGMDDVYSFQPDQPEHVEEGPGPMRSVPMPTTRAPLSTNTPPWAPPAGPATVTANSSRGSRATTSRTWADRRRGRSRDGARGHEGSRHSSAPEPAEPAPRARGNRLGEEGTQGEEQAPCGIGAGPHRPPPHARASVRRRSVSRVAVTRPGRIRRITRGSARFAMRVTRLMRIQRS